MKFNWKRSTIVYILLLVATIVLFSFLLPRGEQPEEIPISELVSLSQEGSIEKIVVDSETLNITTVDGTEYITYKEYGANLYDITGFDPDALNVNGDKIEIDVTGVTGFDWLWIGLALIADIASYGGGVGRQRIPGYQGY